MRLGLLLPTGERPGMSLDGRAARWHELRDLATLAEAVGFDTLFVPDHLLFREAPRGGAAGATTQGIWESWTLLAALAATTTRIELGPLVACNGFRHPALLAKMADTLDEVSGGRLILGLGAGWHQPEHDAFGFPFDHRAGRLEEAFRVILPLLRDGHLDFDGKRYQVHGCVLRPRGPRTGRCDGARIPVWSGARQPRALRVVARYADVFADLFHLAPEELAEPFARLDAACRDVGRDPATIRRATGVPISLLSPGEATDLPAPRALTGAPAEIADRLDAFRAAGVFHITCLLYPRDRRGIERFAPVIELLRRRGP